MSIYIQEGLLEGYLTSLGLRKALKKRGHSIIKNPEVADTIIAHSSGWVFLPKLRDTQQLILVDPVYPTNEPLVARSLKRAKYDLVNFVPNMIAQRALNLIYLAQLPKWLKLHELFYNRSIDEYIMRPNTTICRVADPAWWSDDKLYKSPATIVFIGSDHDGFWRNPEAFIQKVDSI